MSAWLTALLIVARVATAGPPDRNETLIRRRPRSMSLTLVDVARDAGEQDRLEVAYYLGRCFEHIGLLQSAHRQYVRAIPDPELGSRALSGLIRVAERIGDDEPVIPIAAAADPATYPEAFSGALFFLRARHLARAGDRAGAEADLHAVPSSSPRYPASLLVRSVLRQEAGDAEGARDVLLTLLSLRAPRSQLARASLGPAQQLARLNLARLYYAAHRFEEAVLLYDTVDGPWAAAASVESAWASFFLDDAQQALTRLSGDEGPRAAHLRLVLTPEHPHEDWAAEADALRALVREHESDPGGLWTLWFGEGEDVSVQVPDAFFVDALRDVRLSGAALRLRQIERELVLIESQDAAWRDVFAETLTAHLQADREQLTERAGRRLLSALSARASALEALDAMAGLPPP